MASALRTAILALTPDLYWPLDELSGTVAHDISGNGHNGTYQGTFQRGFPGVPGDSGAGAIQLNGQPSSAPFWGAHIAGLADSGTLTVLLFFFNRTSTFSVSEVPWSWSANGTQGYYGQFNSASSRLNGQIGQSGGYVVVNVQQIFSDFLNAWHMWSITWNAAAPNFSVYLDAAFQGSSSSITLHGTPPTTDFTAGFFNATSPTQPYTGGLAHVAKFNSVLTNTQLQTIFNASGALPASVGNIQAAATSGASPTTYTLGTAVTGLTGFGTIAVPNLYGCIVTITTFPPGIGQYGGTPPSHKPALGRIRFSDLNGDSHGTFVEDSPQIILAPDRTNAFLRYSFASGVHATVQPITIP
jgi:hypothetical protein